MYYSVNHKRKIINIFQKTKGSCIAYQNILKKNEEEENNIPIIDKEIYFEKTTIKDRLKIGFNMCDYYMVCSSSGSTGLPTFWPRDIEKDDKAELTHSAFIEEHFNVYDKRTLVVIALDLGSTTAGMMHTRLVLELTRKAKVSVITPGCRPEEIARMCEELYIYYDQVVILAFPTILSEIIDISLIKKYHFKKWNLGIGFTGGGGDEFWRKNMSDMFDISLKRIVSFYGCTEVGLIGLESKIVNEVINICVNNRELIRELFGCEYLPTVVDNLIPNKYFEIVDGELIVTVDQPMPLVRYNIHDYAKFIEFNEIKKKLKSKGIYLNSLENTSKKLVVIYGRNVNRQIMLEDIRGALGKIKLDDFLDEFQYDEKYEEDGTLMLGLDLYLRDNLAKIRVNKEKLENKISKILGKKIRVKLRIRTLEERIGYQSGKLTYYR